MTLLVGILATDGVVLAADSAVTFGDGEQRPTIADSHRKLVLSGKYLVIAGTDEVGLGQQFQRVVKELHGKNLFKKGVEPEDAAHQLCAATVKRFAEGGIVAALPPRGIGYGALLAYATDRPHLVEFAPRTFQPECKTRDCWYASMGSGQSLADPYLALMRRSAWQEGQPNIEDATFAAYWVMQQAIAAAPGFIAEPIDIAVVRRWNGKEFEAKMLNENELSEHKNRALEANQQLRQALCGQLQASPEAPPIPNPT